MTPLFPWQDYDWKKRPEAEEPRFRLPYKGELYASPSGIEFGKLSQGVVQRYDLITSMGFRRGDAVDIKELCGAFISSPLGCAIRSSRIDQNVPHHLCRNRKEVCAIAPIHVINID